MARTGGFRRLETSAKSLELGKRPIPIPKSSFADLGLVYATSLNDEEIILLPKEYGCEIDEGDEDGEEAEWQRETYNSARCQQATVAYERMGDGHRNVLPFLRRDPWTAFPILATPPGQPLAQYIQERKEAMYSAPLDTLSTRISPAHRPMIYDWALHLISALSFIHSHDIVFGYLSQANCWIVSSPEHNTDSASASASSYPSSLSIFGFVDAAFENRPEDVHLDDSVGGCCYVYTGRYKSHGSWCNSPYYPHSSRNVGPTKQSDILLYGCVLYELMVGVAHQTPAQWEVAGMVTRRQGPMLEKEYMGDIIRKCGMGEYGSAEEVKNDVGLFVQVDGKKE